MILDDASRMVLAGGEFSEINTENSKLVIDQMVERYWWLCPLRELIMDHGSEFGAHRIHDDGSWSSEFKGHLERCGIKPILARVKHPQTNGKLERFFGEYKLHRSTFSFHSGSLSTCIMIDLMEVRISKAWRPHRWLLGEKCQVKPILALVIDCSGCNGYMNKLDYIKCGRVRNKFRPPHFSLIALGHTSSRKNQGPGPGFEPSSRDPQSLRIATTLSRRARKPVCC